jgi:hypothetical protein
MFKIGTEEKVADGRCKSEKDLFSPTVVSESRWKCPKAVKGDKRRERKKATK